MWLYCYLPKRVHHIGEFDIPVARIQTVRCQILLDVNLSFDGPKSSTEMRQVIYQLLMFDEYIMASFGRP
jgi:hypothetical protein